MGLPMANESVQPCSTSIQSEAKLFSPRTKIVLQGGIISIPTGGCCDHDHMVVGLQLPVQSVPITTKVVTSNPAQWLHCCFSVFTATLFIQRV